MPRIPYPDVDRMGDAEAAAAKLNVQRMLCHLPENVRERFEALGSELLWSGTVDPKIREIAIVRVGHRAGAAYEVGHHEAIAVKLGVPEATLQALREMPVSPALPPIEQATIAFSDALCETASPSDQVLAAVQAHFSSSEIMELAVAIGFYMMVCRVLGTFGVDMDPVTLASRY